MKHLIVALLGLVIGVAGAAAVLYYNPFSAGASDPPGSGDRVFRYSLPGDVLEFAVGEDARRLGLARSGDELWEETIDRTAVLGLVLRDADDRPQAIASRLLSTSRDTDLLLHGFVFEDYWLVTAPGEGTLFVHADSNAWPFLKETLLPVWYFGEALRAPAEYWPTVGPEPDGGIAVGLAGTFGGSEGRAVERYAWRALDPVRDAVAADAELHVSLAGPQVAISEDEP
jgi:hypothetical protein